MNMYKLRDGDCFSINMKIYSRQLELWNNPHFEMVAINYVKLKWYKRKEYILTFKYNTEVNNER